VNAVGEIKRNGRTLSMLAATFLCGLILGAIAYPALEEETRELASSLRELIGGGNQLQTAFKVFLKNTESTLITLALGPTIVLPPLVVFSNGFVTGLVVRMALEEGKPAINIIASLIPHGIVELTAFFLTAALGMNTGFSIINPKGKTRLKAAEEAAKKALLVYATTVLPLLLAAEFAEVYISTKLI